MSGIRFPSGAVDHPGVWVRWAVLRVMSFHRSRSADRHDQRHIGQSMTVDDMYNTEVVGRVRLRWPVH